MMVKITIPHNNIPEREYVIKCIFKVFLGIEDYSIDYANDTFACTKIAFNNRAILIEDTLWKEEFQYLSNMSLPNPIYYKGRFTTEDNLPVLYGNACIEKDNNIIHCGIDIFASVFFMLSRWEEYVVNERDIHGRFIGKKSIAYNNNFLNRPIVNEYVEFLWNMMKDLGYKGVRKEKEFQVVLTHDIDYPYMKYRFLRVSKYMAKSLIKGDFLDALSYIPYFFYDPYDTYTFFMDISDSIDVKSRFYLMSSCPDEGTDYPSSYLTRKYNSIVTRIIKRGHVVGFHPGYSSLLSEANWRREKKQLEGFLGFNVHEGRQHYLRMFVPSTLTLWENNEMDVDSTLSYHDVEGFRCGTGDEFPVFNFVERKELRLIERPLIVMDATLELYQDYTSIQIEDTLEYYLSLGRKYNMTITLLFHNSSFLGIKGRKLKAIYRRVVEKNLRDRQIEGKNI